MIRLPHPERVPWMACALGAVGLFVGIFADPLQLFRSYWWAWVFCAGLSFGSLAVVALQALTGGGWSRHLRRPAETAASMLPLMALLMAPVAFRFGAVFPWAHGMPGDWPHHRAYLRESWFWIRAAVYFGIMIYLSRALLASRGPRLLLGGLTALAYVLCMNFASTDWVMSLEPQWYSTIFAVIFMAGQFLSALALCAIVALLRPAAGLTQPILRDIGNLLLAFITFWAYVTFSQFLIIWSGNLPREISWYVHRRSGGWPAVALMIGVLQFALPFALLLLRAIKHRPLWLITIAAIILGANALHLYWLVAPAYHPTGVVIHWLDAAALLFIGGAWTSVFQRRWSTREVEHV